MRSRTDARMRNHPIHSIYNRDEFGIIRAQGNIRA
jgi:hypothetical protein